MISIVTAYYNRRCLLIRTLDSLKANIGTVDFEMIVVDDGSKEEERLEDLQEYYPFLRICRLEPSSKWYKNPCIPFNIGFELVKGDKIIIQNPECYHFHNILAFVDKNLHDNLYLSFGCFSLDKENTDSDSLFYDNTNINSLIENNPHIVHADGELGWYNHSLYRPDSLHFCTAITKKDLFDLGGFDERYAKGYGYDDNEFVYRVRLRGLKVTFVDSVIVLHQNHYNPSLVFSDSKANKYSTKEAIINKRLFEEITCRSLNYKSGILFSEAPLDLKKSVLNSFVFKILRRLKINF